MPRSTRLIGALGAALLATLLTGTAATSASGSEHGRPDGGVVLLGPEPAVSELPANLALAWHEANELSERNSQDLGYAWVDRASGTVVLDVVNARGRAVAAGLTFRNARPDTKHAERTVTFSRGRLERIKNEASSLAQMGVPGADAIFMTEPDAQQNRIVITVKRRDGALFAELARRYGTEAIAVRVDSSGSGLPGSRNNDTSPFYGSAYYEDSNGGSCTTGFAWISGSDDMMITAGHCVYDGPNTWTPAQDMGYVNASSEESWNPGTGTVLMTGQTTYRGDIGLIRMYSDRSSYHKIYRGIGPTTTTTGVVGAMAGGRATVGQSLCHGGYNGDVCGWVVKSTGVNYTYGDGSVLRTAVRAEKKGWCFKPGDSGAPVYFIRSSDGKVVAQGIASGDTRFGGSDYYAGAFDASCRLIFTDIWDAWYGFPGVLQTG